MRRLISSSYTHSLALLLAKLLAAQLCSGAHDWRKGSGGLNWSCFLSRIYLFIKKVPLLLKLARM